MHQLLLIAILSIHIWPNNKTNICMQANVFRHHTHSSPKANSSQNIYWKFISNF